MTQQLQGEVLFARTGSITTPSQCVYTPWMKCRGSVAVFGIEIFKITSGLTLTWSVQTKTSEDPDSAASELGPATGISETTAGLKYSDDGSGDMQLPGCKELYRYVFATGTTASTTEWVNFRELAPAWELNGE